MKKILVTGANGFIGSAVTHLLVEKGYTVRAMVREGSNLLNIKQLDVEILHGDIRDRASVCRAVGGMDAVFHMGALVSFWEPPERLHLFEAINVQGSRHVFDACLAADVEKVVYTSTLSTIGSFGANHPTTEEHSFNLWDMSMEYERSKYSAEFEAWRYAARGLPLVAVLPSAPIGPRDITPAPAGRLLINLLNRKVPAYIDGGANFLHVDDAALGHLLAFEKGRVGERYLIGGQNISVKDLFAAVETLTGIKGPKIRMPTSLAIAYGHALEFWANYVSQKCPVFTAPMAKFSSLHYYIDMTKAEHELGYLPTRSIALAVLEAVTWFVEHGYVTLPPSSRNTLQSNLRSELG
ncbi:MAG: NAD-dependent epimerase/dehydratase family protein [Gammaproteobacteria bacterium]